MTETGEGEVRVLSRSGPEVSKSSYLEGVVKVEDIQIDESRRRREIRLTVRLVGETRPRVLTGVRLDLKRSIC